MDGNDVTGQDCTSHITDLIKTFKAFDVFPNFILHLLPPVLLFVPTA